MLEVHHFLASCWTTHLEVTREPLAYPDRIRHLPAAVAWGGLGAHVDAAAERTWSTVAHVLTYADVYGGDVLRHDPWSAGRRLGTKARRPSALRNAFRAFLGWTALTGFDGGGGCVHVVPAPAAIARVLLRPLQDDLVDDPPSTGPSLRIVEEHHPLLSAALTSIPAIEPGDTVWWHPDLIHAVPPTTGTGRDQILMYIPFAPRCPANDARLDDHRRSFLTGTHPMDFAPARSAQHLTATR
jgi:hypothetical protein